MSADWKLGGDAFLDIDGNELESFAAAEKYCRTTGNYVFVWYQVLRSMRATSRKRKTHTHTRNSSSTHALSEVESDVDQTNITHTRRLRKKTDRGAFVSYMY